MDKEKGPRHIEASLPNMPDGGLTMMPITDIEFARLQDLVSVYFGIKLMDEKRNLVVSRLQNLIRDKGLDSFWRYIDLVENDRTGRELICLVDHISTNHTFFFREHDHFNYLTMTVLPEIEARVQSDNQMDVRIWSAGCAGGDEAYSFLISLMDYLGDNYSLWDAGVLATDISEKSLTEARLGIYPEKRVSQVPRRFLNSYFFSCGKGEFQVKEDLKQEVTFRRLNLKNKEFPFKQAFDVISCRNVMIYFEQDMKDQLIHNFYSLTRKGGYLFIGLSETLDRRKYPYTYVKPGIYKKEE